MSLTQHRMKDPEHCFVKRFIPWHHFLLSKQSSLDFPPCSLSLHPQKMSLDRNTTESGIFEFYYTKDSSLNMSVQTICDNMTSEPVTKNNIYPGSKRA